MVIDILAQSFDWLIMSHASSENLDPNPVDVVALIQRLAKAGGMLSETDVRAMRKVAQCGQDVCRLSVAALVKAANHGPALRQVQSDGTPVSVVKVATGTMPQGKEFSRQGRESHEFLVAHAFYRGRNRDSDNMETRVLFAEPQPLTWGKSALAQVEVNRTRLPSLWELGHRGYAIEAYC